MPERWSSFFILLGVVLVVLALWYLSFLVVRWDTRRRGVKPLQRKAWIAAAVALPLFGFAVYLFTRVLQRYLTPPDEISGVSKGTTDVLAAYGISNKGSGAAASGPAAGRSAGGHSEPLYEPASKMPMPEPAWGNTAPAHSNGKTHSFATPETVSAAYQPLQGRYSLLVVEGPLQGQQFVIKTLPTRIGRGTEAGIALDADLNVSRKHAEIYEWNGALRIRDLGSMHGTLLNGISVNDQALTPGDRITLGGTVLVLRELP